MASFDGPVLVRGVLSAKPGLHSHNLNRAFEEKARGRRLLALRVILLILGLCGLGYYGYAITDQYVYQAYQNWAFDQQIAGHKVTFADYLREQTPFAFLVGKAQAQPVTAAASEPGRVSAPAPEHGSLLGRVAIGRLNLEAIVREGVDADTLSRAVGHVPTTGLAGQVGNFAIAAHRDTLFRALKDIRNGDLVNFESAGGTYSYEVFSTRVVRPSDVSVLRPDGGFPHTAQTVQATGGSTKLLTMITCYPFYYVGSAPKRFIVQAKLVSSGAGKTPAEQTAHAGASPANHSPPVSAHSFSRSKTSQHASLKEPRRVRGSSTIKHASSSPSATKHNKRGFWRKLLHPREDADAK